MKNHCAARLMGSTLGRKPGADSAAAMAGGGSSRLPSPALAGVIIRTIMKKIRWSAALLAACFLWAQATPPADAQKAANERRDYIKAHYTKHEFPIPMRDGVRLFTSIYAPKNEGEKYPILLNRTPYTVAPYGDDNYRTNLGPSEKFFREGFIFVYQDVRGKGRSEGHFVHVRPHNPNKKSPKDIDESSDTWDTVDWLLKNVANNNG